MDLNSSDLSGIPADLLAAHESQKGSQIPFQPVRIEPTKVQVKKEEESAKDNSVEACNPSDKDKNGNKGSEQMDTIDKAIADKETKLGEQEEGYESSDIELSSDDDDNDSDDSDSSSSSDNEGDDDQVNQAKGGNKDRAMMDYDEEEDTVPDGIVKTAHEIVDIVIQKPHFEFNPSTEVIYAGNIYQIIDNVVVIHCRPGAEHSTLDQGSLLVFQEREILGEVFETFGPVSRPYYSVRFNNAADINTNLCKVGDPVFYVPSYGKTQIVKTEELKKIKGYDASNMYDEELNEEDMEFSDDEKEMEYKRKKNKEKRLRNTQRSNNQGPPKRGRILPNDFVSALADYESIQAPFPPRQQQSYADLNEGYAPPQSWPVQSPHQQMMPPQANNAYQTPADLVSNLFKTAGNHPANQSQQQQPEKSKESFQSIFAEPPPPSSS